MPATAVPQTAAAAAKSASDVQIMTKDVLEYALNSDEWKGQYGSVTFKLHEGRFNGKAIYYIRTDTSESNFAEEVGLVYIPCLMQGLVLLNHFMWQSLVHHLHRKIASHCLN